MAKDLSNWNPDDQSQWESTGKAIANRNLWISSSCLCNYPLWGLRLYTQQFYHSSY